MLVDKTPLYASDLNILRRAKVSFSEAKYLFISRHPVPCIESWVDLTKKNLALQNKIGDIKSYMVK